MSNEVAESVPTETKPTVNATPEPKDTKPSPPPSANVKSPQPKENGEAGAAGALPSLKEQFKAFSKFGDTKSDGKTLTLSQSDKWMKQAKVIDAKTITTTDTGIHFKKFKQMKIMYPDYEKYLADLAKAKNIEVTIIKNKMRGCGLPGTSGTTAVLKNQAVDRLTDTKKFTGSHKIRVEESKGKPATGTRK